MEFADIIRISRVDNVRLRRPAEPHAEVTVAVTGHHLILSLAEVQEKQGPREIWLLHRNVQAIGRGEESGGRSGTISLRYKDLRLIHLDIIGTDKYSALLQSLEQLAQVKEPTASYPYFYSPGFRALEDGWCLFRPEEELAKLLKGGESEWRLTKLNSDFALSPSSGRLLLVPASLTDAQLEGAAKYRIGGRLPTLVARHKAVPLVRASAPLSPGRRSIDDEKAVAAVLCGRKRGFILDVQVVKQGERRQGDMEAGYPRWKKVVVRLPGLQELRDSLTGLTVACNDVNSDKWLSRLANTRWLSHVKEALNAACLAAQCLEKEDAPVMVVEQEGRDMALLITSLALIILDPDARTLHGFEALVEREWIQTGHPFWTRNGSNLGEGQNLVAPVFLLFLDCVYQIHTQFPCSFEFSPGLLVVLADHSCSSNFGTFLWDCEKERRDGRVREQTVSLWSFLNQVEILSQHLNCLYLPQPTVIWPSVAPMSLGLWSGYFLRWVQAPVLTAGCQERRRMGEIVERNKAAQGAASKLRRELQELIEEAVKLGVLDADEEESSDEKEDFKKEDLAPKIVEKSHPLEV